MLAAVKPMSPFLRFLEMDFVTVGLMPALHPALSDFTGIDLSDIRAIILLFDKPRPAPSS